MTDNTGKLKLAAVPRALLPSMLAVVALAACGSSETEQEASGADMAGEMQEAAMDDDYGEASEEEPGIQLSMNQSYDEMRAGTRLVIAYDAETNAFRGTVSNVGEEELAMVRVEVHLSNGTELGPTTPVDLAPGEMSDVMLEATAESFETWSAHAEVGEGEHGSGEEGEHGSDGEEGGEHEGERSGG